jgi:ATP-binding cassette, subfamily B, bacterial
MSAPDRQSARLPLHRLREGRHRIRSLLGDRIAPVLLLTGASVGAGLAEAGVLALLAEIASVMVLRRHRVTSDFGPIGLHIGIAIALLVALVLASARLVLGIVVAWLPAKMSAGVQAQLRADLFDAFTRSSWSVQADEVDGHLQELMTNQIMQATQAVLNLTTFMSSGLMFLTLVASAFFLNVQVALVVLATSIALFWLLRPLSRLGRVAAIELSQANVDTAAGVSETVRLSEESQVFGTAESQRRRIGIVIEASRRAFFRFVLTARVVQNGYQSLVILLIVGGLSGLYLVGATNLGALGAVVLILIRASSYGQVFQSSYHTYNQMLPYLDRLEAATNRYRSSAIPDGGRSLPVIRELAFERVTFGYNRERPVLFDISFSVQAGESIGIVGPTGAGKSTLVQLLLRLRDSDAGAFLVNGEAASTFSRSDWQQRVAYVSQDPRVFQGSVADNIRFFRNLDQSTLERAARLAHVHDDIIAMPNGYETVIGQRSDAVSGGQRQRIALARALASEPEVLVLDEPTSSLDLESEAAVQSSLAALRGRVTLFIVAHRITTLSDCGRVLVISGGRVQAFAPARELERTNAFYRRAVSLMTRGTPS